MIDIVHVHIYIQWLLKYNLESLGLNFSQLEVQKHQQEKTYRHINKKVYYFNLS